MASTTDPQQRDDATTSFAMSFIASDAFRSLFKEGMLLVEDAASYLDGKGRTESKLLGRGAALSYAGESMRLTTRLMQIASWLLLQRAVAEGELSSAQATREKHKVNLRAEMQANPLDAFEELPLGLRDLIARSLRLQARILHLDQLLAGKQDAPPDSSPVAAQVELLRSAFLRQ